MIGAAGEIRTPEVRHHWISNPAQWPGYATAARISPTCGLLMKMTVLDGGLFASTIASQRAEEAEP